MSIIVSTKGGIVMKKNIFYALAIFAIIISTLSSAVSFIINVNHLGVLLLFCAYISGILLVKVKRSYQV